MSDKMIPFGKYKGQPIEVLQNDPQYAEWIAQQQWAKERYPSIVNIIINKFGENEETPDHNAMQAKFMSKGYCAAAYLTLGGFKVKHDAEKEKHAMGVPDTWDDFFVGVSRSVGNPSTCGRHVGNEPLEKLSDMIHDQEFEVRAVDISFQVEWISINYRFAGAPSWAYWGGGVEVVKGGHARIELKPVIGDDYPAVLRQMRNNGSNALVYGEYTGVGVPEQTFRAFFATQGIRVCAEKEISDRIAERAKEKISEIKNAIAEQEKILRSRVTVS